MAHVSRYRLASGAQRWRAIWELPAGIDGKRRTDSKGGFAKLSEAKAFAAKMSVEIEQKGVGDPDRHDLGRFLKRWLATLARSGDYEVPTLINYGHQVRRISALIGPVPLSEVTAGHIDQAYGTMLASGLSAGTVRAAHSVLKTALTRARRWKLIGTNPADDARPPKAKNRRSVRSLSHKEAARILAAVDNPSRRDTYPGLAVLVHLALGSGLRRGELLGLAFDAIEFETGLLTVIEGQDRQPILREGKAKTAKSLRTIRLSAPMLERLRQHKVMTLEQRMKWGREYAGGPLLVFPTVGGGVMKPAKLDYMLRTLMKRAGVIGVQPVHCFRHSHASWLMSSGANPKVVSERMGHATPAFTLTVYAHPETIEDQAAADTIEAIVQGVRAAQDRA